MGISQPSQRVSFEDLRAWLSALATEELFTNTQAHKGGLWGEGNVLCLDLCGFYLSLSMCVQKVSFGEDVEKSELHALLWEYKMALGKQFGISLKS